MIISEKQITHLVHLLRGQIETLHLRARTNGQGLTSDGKRVLNEASLLYETIVNQQSSELKVFK